MALLCFAGLLAGAGLVWGFLCSELGLVVTIGLCLLGLLEHHDWLS